MHKTFEETRDEFKSYLDQASDTEWAVSMYVYQMGLTYAQVNILEDAIIGAMLICDKIKVKTILGEDAKNWEIISKKGDVLYQSTLGSLITILSKHGISEKDINYLRWVKERRDIFVHRFFRDGRWPAKIAVHHCVPLCRQLQYLQAVFYRASQRITTIFVSNGLMTRYDVGGAGSFIFNVGDNPFDGGEKDASIKPS